jgi:hypothetical protein
MAINTNILLPEIVDAMAWPDSSHATLSEQILANAEQYLQHLNPDKAAWLELCPKAFASDVVDDINFYASTMVQHGDLHDILLTILSTRIPRSAPQHPYGDPDELLESFRDFILQVHGPSPTSLCGYKWIKNPVAISALIPLSQELLRSFPGFDAGGAYLYHATRLNFALDLLSEPIQFTRNRREPRDFGFGFYLATRLEHAMDYFLAHRPGEHLAILVYRKPDWDPQTDVRCISDTDWPDIVIGGHTSPVRFNRDNMIIPPFAWYGPMCFNVNVVRHSHGTPTHRLYPANAYAGQQQEIVYQYCVKGNSMDATKNLARPVCVLVFRNPLVQH